MKAMGRNEYARHRGCAPNAVTKAVTSGRIAQAATLDESGRIASIDAQLADQLWAQNTDPAEAAKSKDLIGQQSGALDRMSSAGGDVSAARSETGDDTPQPAAGGNADQGEYLAARAKREGFQAKQAELDYLEAIGELVSKRDHRQVSARRYRALRDAFLNIPDRVAAPLAAERDPARIHAELTKEIKRVLHELSDDARAEIARGVTERVAA